MQKYSTDTNTEFNLNDYYDKTTMVTAVGNIAYTGGTTNTGKDALDAGFILKKSQARMTAQSPGAVWKSRWTSWAPVPNTPTVFMDVKQHFNKSNC